MGDALVMLRVAVVIAAGLVGGIGVVLLLLGGDARHDASAPAGAVRWATVRGAACLVAATCLFVAGVWA